MSSKTKEPAQPCALTTQILQDGGFDTPPKLSDRYIIIAPAFFDEILDEKLDYINSEDLRDKNLQYQNSDEDSWAGNNAFCADLLHCSGYDELVVYVRAQGRLYCLESVIDVATVISELKAQEAAKVIKSPTHETV